MLNLFGYQMSRGSGFNRALIMNKDLPMRRLKLHEYQAGKLLHKYRVPIPLGGVALNSKEALLVARQFGQQRPMEYVVKAQVLGGGRGLGHFRENNFQGGVHLVKTPEQVAEIAEKMCGKTLVTKQSGEAGLPCNLVYIVEKLSISKEYYLSLTLDRKAGKPVFIYSKAGGMNIEDVAHNTPDQIFKIHVDINQGLNIDDLLQAAKNLDLEDYKSQVVFLFKHLYDCFIEKDADMIEINPLALLADGTIVAADSKVTIDDNALFRQKDLKAEEDLSQQNYKERIAKSFDLNYIYIGGNIGCLVNGAGLAMATMDIIKHYGGNPANFLDVGGSAEGEQMVEAIKLLNNDPEVDSIFINIFGGILRCDNLAQSIINAAEQISLTKPIVLRLKGTNSKIAREMIKPREKELGIFFDDDFDSAARLVVDVAQKRSQSEK
ncbi:succinate-ligase [Stylonychia lemnae]|uniref:Succinate--CoA ligase [ADP-forming] subunit beta, mitochondrial n=1 Tax=Stylonychia lemnae TaxID=5949 RepID=A0A078ATC8_STYLE|nr:succinate-ligase [Stylonychia lemnae]|eukprot:CDW84123.1 succinate-ligase [Stylonychia lemnae]